MPSNSINGRTSRERIFSRLIIDPSGCLLWTGPRSAEGYGRVCVNGRTFRIHRLMYEWFVDLIPEGMQVDHLCRVRHCASPAHLEPVTALENTMRGTGPTAANGAKTHCDSGHEFTEANTYITPRGTRDCRECHAAACRRWRNKRRSADP